MMFWVGPYRDMAGRFGILDGDAMDRNAWMLRDSGMQVGQEEANHIGSLLPVVLGLLAIDEDGFRGFMARAVHGDSIGQDEEKHVHDANMWDAYNISLRKVQELSGSAFTAAVDGAIATYTSGDADEVGRILSNFGYLIDAYHRDGAFRSEFEDRIGRACKKYGISVT